METVARDVELQVIGFPFSTNLEIKYARILYKLIIYSIVLRYIQLYALKTCSLRDILELSRSSKYGRSLLVDFSSLAQYTQTRDFFALFQICAAHNSFIIKRMI